MASFQLGPWVLLVVTAELVILLFISMWQKRRDKVSDSPRDSTVIEELTESIEEEFMTPTLDQMAVVDSEIDAES